ncbi:hypothetical protein PLICRDRAFT_169681 [Plicaturopsis crispa FD-325 SS-3]|nr:hypothetical protein PLICRDRAFT_169681 [Plicaturopsis crispa FD-325 SS-3]
MLYDDINDWMRPPTPEEDNVIGPSLMSLFMEAYGTTTVVVVVTCAALAANLFVGVMFNTMVTARPLFDSSLERHDEAPSANTVPSNHSGALFSLYRAIKATLMPVLKTLLWISYPLLFATTLYYVFHFYKMLFLSFLPRYTVVVPIERA